MSQQDTVEAISLMIQYAKEILQSAKKMANDAGIQYTLEHDDIHEAVKHLEKPAYEYFKDGAVWCSKALWDACSEEVKLYAALEEVYVLSLERSIHPFPNVNREWAFEMALMKISTSISSGWFREYCWENHYKIKALYDASYIDKFYRALDNGLIGKFKGNSYE